MGSRTCVHQWGGTVSLSLVGSTKLAGGNDPKNHQQELNPDFDVHGITLVVVVLTITVMAGKTLSLSLVACQPRPKKNLGRHKLPGLPALGDRLAAGPAAQAAV